MIYSIFRYFFIYIHVWHGFSLLAAITSNYDICWEFNIWEDGIEVSFALLSFVWIAVSLDWFEIWMQRGVEFYMVNFEFEVMMGHMGEEVLLAVVNESLETMYGIKIGEVPL